VRFILYNLYIITSLYNVITKVLFVRLRIRCFMKEQSTLMWYITLFEASPLKMKLRYAR
jgi:hypothetical protein